MYTISEVYKKLFPNLANDLVEKLPVAANKFGNKSVEGCYVCVKRIMLCNCLYSSSPSSSPSRAFQPRPQSNFKTIALAPHDCEGNFYLI